jgi:hypothetical protein
MTAEDNDRAPQPRSFGHDPSERAESGSSSDRPPASSAGIWAGVVVATVAIAATIVTTLVLVNHNNRKPSSAFGTAKPTISRQSTSVPSSPPLPAAARGLASFAREWRGMRESILIDAAGHGHFHYMMPCATCSMAEMPYSTLDFIMTSVSNGTASGTVTGSSDPRNPIGEPVAATLGPQDTVQWALNGRNVGLFCGSNFAWCGG